MKIKLNRLLKSFPIIMLMGILILLFGVGKTPSVHAQDVSSGSHTITHFQGNKPAAVSFTFDDGFPSQVDAGAAQLTARGLTGTFFVITSSEWIQYNVPWATWRSVAAEGHEVASHTVSHPHLSTLLEADVRWELSTAQLDINQNVPNQSCLTIAYPYTDSNEMVRTVVADYYVAGRGGWADEGGFLNYYQAGQDQYGSWSAINFYNIGSMPMDGLGTDDPEFNNRLNRAVSNHAWFTLMFHNVPDAAAFANIVDYVQGKQVYWIDTVGNIARYMKERLKSTVQVIADTPTEIRLNIVMDASLPTSIYNFPLTIRSTVPETWPQVLVQQAVSTQAILTEVEGSETVVYYNAVPNGGEIILTRSNPVPVILSLDPVMAIGGGSSFALTVSGSNFTDDSIIRWNNEDRTTTYISSTLLSATIPASDILSEGTAMVSIYNPPPGGGVSGQLPFTIYSTHPLCYALQVTSDPSNAGSIDASPAPNCENNQYVEGTSVTVTALENPGYQFDHWSGGAAGTSNPVLVTVDGNKSVTANYSLSQYNLTVTSGHGTVSLNPNKSGYTYGEVVQITATPYPGWSFANWGGGATGTSNPISVTMDGNKSVTVNYSQNQYTLTVTSGHGMVSRNPNKSSYSFGEVVQIIATPYPGWTFANWSGGATGTSNPIAVTMDGNKSVTANYSQNQYTLTVTSGHGTVSPNPNKSGYTYGEVVQLTATPDPGWSFANWSGGATGTSNPISVTMNGNKSVTANYSQNQYTLTVTSGHGTVSRNPNRSTYVYGEVVQLTATPDPGWSFASWSGGATGTSNPISVTMNGNKSVTTNYTQNHYSLTVNVSGNGLVTMTPPQSAYNYGDAVQLLAVPDVSWILGGWSGDLSGVMNPESITIDGNKTVTAIFIECFSLTLSHTGNGTMPLVEPAQSAGCPAGRYVEGEVISLSGAVPDVGWLIDGWIGTDHDTDKANTNTVTMPANVHTVFVNYVEMITPVLLSPDGTIDGVSKPDFEWRVYPDVTAYRLAVYSYSAAAYLVLDVVPLSNCNASQCSYPSPVVLANGDYKFKVLAYIPGGVTPYTDWMDFTITGVSVPPPPYPPVPISPSGTVTSHRPTLTWGAVEYATFYRLALYSNAARAYLFVENVYPSCVAGVCSYTPTIDLVNGDYKFKLLARNSSGYTAYGNFMGFTVSSNLPVAPALLAPSGTVSTNKPQIKWSVVSGATRYRLAVYSNATRSYVILTDVYPGACSGGVCSYIPPSVLASGDYKFKLLAINSYGMSDYSEWMPFKIP